MNFPTLLNHCHHAHPVEAVNLNHQGTYCMSVSHRSCPVFLRSLAAPLPQEITAYPKSKIQRRIAVWGFMALFFLIVGIFLFAGGWEWAGANMWFVDPTATNTHQAVIEPSSTVIKSATPTITYTPIPPSPTEGLASTATNTPTDTNTPAPSLTETIRPTPTPGGPTCGPPPGWVQYTVKAGDTLTKIGAAHGASVIQLQDANCLGSATKIYTGQKLWVPFIPTVTNTATPSLSPTPTTTFTPSDTVIPSDTPTPTYTLTPVDTSTPSNTPTPSDTPIPPTETDTPIPPTVTNTPDSYP